MNLPRPVLMSAVGLRREKASWASAAVLVGALVLAALMAAPARADEYSDVGQLLRAGKTAEALARADQYLASKPRDPQMRFIKGVIQTETGRSQEAIATFQRLTEDYPELPEPYNNLAVLYANQNQFDRARSALEMAIRTNPSYSTAHENLGDVYARLASQAYSRALQLDGANSGVQPKLALIRDLFSLSGRVASGAAAASAPPAAGSVVAGTTTGPVAAANAPAPPVQPQAAAGASTAAPSAVAAAQQPAARPASSTSSTAVPASAITGNARQDVSAAIQAWAAAWAAKDMGRYLGAYGRDFAPPDGQSRAEWEAERAERILSKTRISVVLSDVQVSASTDRATARFRQAYSADGLRINSRKTLELSRTGERWLILRESTGG